MNFFLDNTFSPRVASALAILAKIDQHSVSHLLEYYTADPGDLAWIPEIGRWDGDWTILTGDRRMYTNPQRRAALLSSKRTVFFMPSRFPDMVGWEQAWRIFKWFPAIQLRAVRTRGQKLFDVSESGRIEVLKPSR